MNVLNGLNPFITGHLRVCAFEQTCGPERSTTVRVSKGAKFRKMARAVLADDCIEKLIEAVDRLEIYEDAAKLIPLLVK